MKTGIYKILSVLLIALIVASQKADAQLLKYKATISNAKQSKGYYFLAVGDGEFISSKVIKIPANKFTR